jgi:glycosyltransferase involved in cell wall biosynthesis
MNISDKPEVSVIMASYNHAPFVAEAIQSVLSQGGVNFEFLIADDGSKDETREIIAAHDDHRITFFPNEVNRGACMVTNDLISRVSGKYIALINSDDAWLPGKLLRQLNFLEANPGTAAHFGRATFIDREGGAIDPKTLPYGAVFEQENRSGGLWLRRFFAHANCLCHPTIMVRREAYDQLGPFNNRLRQLPDYDMWIRMVRRYEIHVSEESLINFRVLPGENASGPTRTNAVRTLNEHFLIAQTFFDGVSREKLIEGFHDILVIPEIPSPVHLEIEKMLLFLHANQWLWRPYKMVGLSKANDLLSDPEARAILEMDYGVSDHWFHAQMASVDVMCPAPQEPLSVSDSLRSAFRAIRRNVP